MRECKKEPAITIYKTMEGRTVVDIRTPMHVPPYLSSQILTEYLTQFDGCSILNRPLLTKAIQHPDVHQDICVCMNGREVTWVDDESTGGPA